MTAQDEGTRIAALERLLQDKDNELKRQKRLHGAAVLEKEGLEQTLELVRSIRSASPRVPTWRQPKRSKRAGTYKAIPTLMLSDLHLDEVVNPAEVEFYNSFDREIAEARLRHTAQTTVRLLRDFAASWEFDGFVLMLGGDILTGDIHQELLRTNETTVFDSIVHWVPQLAAFIDHLLRELDVPLHVPCVVGNHDRNPANRRVPSKMRAKDSISWVIYQWLADRYRDDDRVTFQVSEAADILVPIYDTTYMLTHGDQFKGGSGIAGVTMPIMRGAAKKLQRQSAFGADKRFDMMVLGHFHQLMFGQGIIVNGSLKGYDEYAYTSNFTPEPPQQALWLTTPEHGIAAQYPVFAEADNEKWRT